MSFLRVEIRPSFREISGKFTKANEALLKAKRKEMQALGRQYVRLAQSEAPKKSGKFAKGIGFKTRQQGEVITMTTHMPQPLGTYITQGTKPHWIQAKNKAALAFFWPKFGGWVVVPKRGGFPTHVRKDGTLWIGKGGVNHPGTKENPFHERAYNKWQPSAQMALRRMAVNWQEAFTA